jgi:hypothetical protein
MAPLVNDLISLLQQCNQHVEQNLMELVNQTEMIMTEDGLIDDLADGECDILSDIDDDDDDDDDEAHDDEI